MKIIDLTIGKVEIIENLTWGIQEEIKSSVMSAMKISDISDISKPKMDIDPSAILKTKYKTLELCIKKITLNDGTEIAYSKEWMDNLSIEDGDKLFDAVDSITNPKKK